MRHGAFGGGEEHAAARPQPPHRAGIGEVYLDGEPTGAMHPLALRRRVGMIFQLPALFGALVEEEILYGPRLIGRDADARKLLE